MKDPKIRIGVFLTLGNSFESWRRSGILHREVRLYQRLRDFGIKTTFISYGGPDDLELAKEFPEIDVVCNKHRLPGYLYRTCLPLIHGEQLRRCDILKTNQSMGGEIARRAARYLQKPLVARCGYMWSEFAARQHGEGSKELRRALSVESKLFLSADRVIVATEAMRRSVEDRFPDATPRIRVFPNYVDTDKFKPQKNGNPSRDIVFIGRLCKQKNLVLLLDAIADLDVTAIIVGEGDQEEGLRRRYGTMKGRIEWRGTVSHEQLPEIMKDARLLVMPSLYEGHPKALLEGMAAGLPVIGTNVPGVRELLEDGENGIVSELNAIAMRNAICRVLEQPELAERLAYRGRKLVQDEFSLDEAARRECCMMQELYHQRNRSVDLP